MSEIFKNKFFSNLNKSFIKNIIIYYSFNSNKLFVTKDDLVYGFGENIYGFLGLGHNRKVTEPTIIKQLCNKQIIELYNGLNHCIARSIDGKLYSFGSNDCNQLGYKTKNEDNNRPKIIESLINENIIQVSCGDNHTIVLTQNGEVFGWGDNSWGEIGIKCKEKLISIPTKTIGFNGEKIQSISCGGYHSMALTENGNVFSWGRNSWGQLGINSTHDFHIPQIIRIKDNKVLFKKISCGSFHSLLLSTNGDIYSFGWNDCKQLGYETSSEKQLIPKMIEMNTKIYFSDILCHFYEEISIALSSIDRFCYIWGKCGEQDIKSLKKTEYKSCEEAIFDNTENTVRAINCHFFENNYSIINRISNGSFGEVFKCENRETKELSAVKRIEIQKIDIKYNVREREVMSKLKNEYIVEYKQSWIESNENYEYFLYLEMELCSKTLNELKEQIYEELNCKTSICESLISFYIMSELIKEVIEGVNYLHKNNIIHRDLKPQNILINDIIINGKCVRIADFGLSCNHSEESMTCLVGTEKYMSPELKQSSNRSSNKLIYSYKVDIYSLGVIIEQIFDLFSLSSKTFNDKVENLIKMKDCMVSYGSESRPDCDEILDKTNEWSICLEELTQSKKLSNILSQKFENESMNEHFVQYFLRYHLNTFISDLKITINLMIRLKYRLIDKRNIEVLIKRLNEINISSNRF